MQKVFIKDLKKRKLYLKYYSKRLILKSLHQNLNLTTKIRAASFFLLSKLRKQGSKVQLKNLCLITHRSKSVDKTFKISRITFKKFMDNGLLSQVYKASW